VKHGNGGTDIVASSVLDRLPVVEPLELGELIGVLLEQVAERPHHSRPVDGRQPRPGAGVERPSWSSQYMMLLLICLGAKLLDAAQQSAQPHGTVLSFLLGIATGLLWVPCVGPMLGLILTCAALKAQVSAGRRYSFYAAGAATSLALALADGGRLLASMK
jgi:cytochrome c biogenesis protein CcdA